jgi:hypothetical protein
MFMERATDLMAYEPPQVIELGEFGELTRGMGEAGYDDLGYRT